MGEEVGAAVGADVGDVLGSGVGEFAKLIFVTTTVVAPETTEVMASLITVVKAESYVASDVEVIP